MAIRCPGCGFDNDASHRFCAGCGNRLGKTCPACGRGCDPTHRFCPECGTALTDETPAPRVDPESASPAATERRLVTILFCDLVGFTTLSERLDPERVRALLTSYFDRCRGVVEGFGGEVDKFTGDAITVFWGAKRTEPDDAERAVRAGLELVEEVLALGEETGIDGLQLRVGVNTGEAAVGPGGNEKGLVLGDVVNTAARLQAIAEPGTVVVGDTTKRLTDGAIAYQDLGLLDLKGKEETVRGWKALRVESARRGRGRTDGIEPPFVGRQYELRMLKELLAVTGEERRARLVSIVGDAGIGKSRLAWEFQKYVDGIVETVYWHEGRSPAYRDGVTLRALSEMVRQRAGIGELEDQEKARLRLRTAVTEYVPNADERRWIEPRLAGLLGLDPMPAGDRAELYAAIRTFIQRISDRGTVVLVLEDFHWADDGLIEFIEELVDRSPNHPILVLSLARPELLERAESWGGGRPNLTSLNLGPISESAMRELVEGTVTGLDPMLVNEIVDRAAGVPLYAVEMIRMLATDGTLVATGDGKFRAQSDVITIAVPDSLQAVVGARIDRLEPDLRELLKNAAVLGQSFTVEGLGVVTGESPEEVDDQLARLVAAEVLRYENDPRSPERGQYKFVQSLIREVAYSRLTLAERKERHLAVADYFESIGEVELATVVASHLFDAFRADPEAPDAQELAARGRQALVRAAHRAADLHSHRQVLRLAARAAAMATSDEERGELEMLKAWAARGLGDMEGAIEAARAAADFYQDTDFESHIRAVTLLGRCLSDEGRHDDAIEVMESLAALRAVPETVADVELAAALARSYMLSNHPEHCLRVAEAALATAERLDRVEPLVDLLITKAGALMELERGHESLALLRGALALAEAHDLTMAALRAHNNISVVLEREDDRAATENARRAWAKALALGDPVWMGAFGYNEAVAAEVEGRYDDARAVEAQLGDRMTDRTRRQFAFLWAYSGLTRGEVDLAEALETLQATVDPQDPQTLMIHDHFASEAHLLVGDFDRAHELAQRVGGHIFGYPYHLETALHAALWTGEPERIESATSSIERFEGKGRMIDCLRLLADAALAHGEGRMSDAIALGRRYLDEVVKIRYGLSLALAIVPIARLFGLDHPLGEEAAEEAHRLLSEQGRTRLLTTFADCLPTSQPEAAIG